MSDLVEFLRARLAATEQALIEYREHRQSGPHVNYEGQDWKDYDEYGPCSQCVSTAKATPYSDVVFGLAEVAAKRQIIAIHGPQPEYGVVYCQGCGLGNDGEFYMPVDECPENRALAAVYAAHPDYRQAWARDE